MTDEELSELYALAMAADAIGDWWPSAKHVLHSTGCDQVEAAYIAAAHPAAVIALIDEVRRLRKQVEIKDKSIAIASRDARGE